MKRQQQIADHQLIAIAEWGAIDHALAIDERAIAASHVLNGVPVFVLRDDRVAPAYGGHFEYNLAVGTAAHDRAPTRQLEYLTGIAPLDYFETSHRILSY